MGMDVYGVKPKNEKVNILETMFGGGAHSGIIVWICILLLLAKFNMASQINLQDGRTADGMALLVSKNLLTQERATQILTDPVQQDERP